MTNYIKEVEKYVSIDEGEIAIEGFLVAVYLDNPISNKKLARKLCLPIPLITAIKKEFIKLGLIMQYNGMTMTSKGYAYVENHLGFRSINKALYTALAEGSELLDLYDDEDIYINRPSADLSVDQAHCTIETSGERSLLALKHHMLVGKKILCIGDDDLVSVSLGLLLKKLYGDLKHSTTEIHVVDIDRRLLDYIDKLSVKYQLPITCHEVNLRACLPDGLKGQFDCFYTDPPYTLEGLTLFLSRGITGLKHKKGLPIFFSYAHNSYDNGHIVLSRVCEMGLSVNKIMPRFNHYEGASILGNIGQMMILNTTSSTLQTIEGSESYEGDLYTRELKIRK